MLKKLEARVRETVRVHGMLRGGEHVLVAVSGGADSTALLLCLHKLAAELRLSLTVAHLNHRIRASEADDDAEFVRELSANLGVRFVSEIIDVKQRAEDERQNLEEAARRLRYDFLSRAAQQAGAQKIAVGHNLNDQAETTLFRFIRGSGIEGLSAIHPVIGDTIVRPLLNCSRSSILEYLEECGTGYREDSTNSDMRHSRNRIRRELIPYLEEHFNPQLIETLAREAVLSRETWAYMELQAKGMFERLRTSAEGGISIQVEGILAVHPALQKQVFRQALRESMGSLRGITSTHIDSLFSLCGTEQSGAHIQLPRGYVAMRQFGSIIFRKKVPPKSVPFSSELKIPGESFVSEAGAIFKSSICGRPDLKTMRDKRATHAFLEPSKLPESITIRSRLPGDRYGGSGHRKVKKILINARIPMHLRSVLPMVAAGNEVVWIPGFRPARSYEAAPGAGDCILITMERQ